MEDIRSFLNSRTDGRKQVMGFNYNLAGLVPAYENSFFLDEVVLYDLFCRSHRVSEGEDSSWRIEESYQDTLNILEKASDGNIEIYVKNDFKQSISDNFERGRPHGEIIPESEVVEKVGDYIKDVSQEISLSQYKPVEKPDSWDVGYEDRQIVSCALDRDLTIVTYDQHFLPYSVMVDVSTPGNTAEGLEFIRNIEE